MDRSQIDDFNGLRYFLVQSEEIINYIMERRHILILKEFSEDGDFMEMMERAWTEIRPHFHEVRMKLTPETDAISDEFRDLWKRLRRYGLTGTHLKLKITLFDKLWKNFKETKEYRWTKRLLATMNSLFGSLSSIFPGMEAVREFKDVLEQIVKMRR